MNLPKLTDAILHSRPRAEMDWECPRRRYWAYEYDGTGLDAEVESLEQFMGTSLHDGLAAIALFHQKGSVDIDLIAETARQQVSDNLRANGVGTPEQIENFAAEQGALIEGLLRGYHRHAWPLLLAKYPKILAVEADCSFRHNERGEADPKGLWEFMAKPDLVLATEDESEIVYVEAKSTGTKKEQWINSWDKAVQVHATQPAIESTLGVKPTGAIVQGFYKGYVSYGKLSSPMCYAYHRWGNPPFTQTETLYEYRAGYKRYPTWQLEGGVKKWIDGMPSEVLMEQFPVTPTIFPDADLLTRFFSQRGVRELDIRMTRELLMNPDLDETSRTAMLDVTFPQRFNKCKPSWGFECPMQVLCFGNMGDPLKAGMRRRSAHHQTEVDQLKEVDE